jgi:pimeloyl-ACP methyl ester carboxylesterase
MVIAGASKESLESSMKEVIPLLEEVILLPNIGHWVQQEAAEQTNSILIDFLK